MAITAPQVPGAPSLMIFADRLTPQKLQQLGHEYGINALRVEFAAPRAPVAESLRLAADGHDATLRWTSSNPGGKLLTALLPLLVIAMLITLYGAIMLMRNALRKAQLNDENTLLLAQSQRALSASERRFRDIAEITTDWIWEMDEQLRFSWVSAASR